jgi:hypothetical protein
MDLGEIADSLLSSAIVGIFTLFGGIVINRMKKRNDDPRLSTNAVPQQNWYAYRQPPAYPAQPYPMQPGSPIYPAQPGYAPAPARPTVNFGLVLIHVAILQFVANVIAYVVGFIIGFGVGSLGGDAASLNTLLILVLLPVGTIILTIGYFIIGVYVNPAVRWLHLTYVALGTAIATLIVNSVIGGMPTPAVFFAAIVISFVQSFVAMGIGGGLSMLVKRPGAANQARFNQQARPLPQMPPVQPTYPYQPGPYSPNAAPPNAPNMPNGYGAPPSAPQYPPPYPPAPGQQ